MCDIVKDFSFFLPLISLITNFMLLLYHEALKFIKDIHNHFDVAQLEILFLYHKTLNYKIYIFI